MKTHAQPTAELTQLSNLIEDFSIVMLTTKNGQGKLVSRPMCPLEMHYDGTIWFFTNEKSTKVKQLTQVNLSFCNVDKGTYVSISGSGDIVVDLARVEALWTVLARPWFPEGVTSEDLVLIKVTPETAEYWDSSSSKMVRLFAMAASVVTGKPVGLGEHDKLNLAVERRSTTSPA